MLLVVGFALADTLRSDEAAVETRPATSGHGRAATTTEPEEDEDLGRTLMPTVSGALRSDRAHGDRLLRGAGFDLPTGIELPNVVALHLSALGCARHREGGGRDRRAPLRRRAVPVLDLSRRGRDLGTSERRSDS